MFGGRDGDQSEQAAVDSSTKAAESREAIQSEDAAPSATPGLAFGVTPPTADRAQEWDVSLELTVPDNRSLSDASAEAIRTTRELGGIVVSSNVATQGPTGRARLTLRVPQRRVQEAIAQFSQLGTITGQQVSVQDRQADLDSLAKRIDTLRIQLAEVNAKLAQSGLTEVERLQLELRRRRIQGLLNQRTRQRANIASEVALADVSLSLETKRAATTGGGSRFDDAVDDALGILSAAAAVALFLTIVLLAARARGRARAVRPACAPAPGRGAPARQPSPDACTRVVG